MNMLQAAKKTSIKVIYIPVEETSGHREIAIANSSVFEVLKKKKSAEISYWGVPDHKSDVMRRRIRVVRQDKKTAAGSIEDIPDLEDVHYSDLPWIGNVSFNQAPRQFRSKHVLAVVVETVREIDGYLFSLRIDSDKMFEPQPPMILCRLYKAGPLELNHRIDVHLEPTEEQKAAMKAPWEVPPTLIKEMAALDYELRGNTFVHPLLDQQGHRLVCEQYGKLVIEQ